MRFAFPAYGPFGQVRPGKEIGSDAGLPGACLGLGYDISCVDFSVD